MWEITKKYTSTQFENNETSVGYAINVYQESINKVFPEYLVNVLPPSVLYAIACVKGSSPPGLPNCSHPPQ